MPASSPPRCDDQSAWVVASIVLSKAGVPTAWWWHKPGARSPVGKALRVRIAGVVERGAIRLRQASTRPRQSPVAFESGDGGRRQPGCRDEDAARQRHDLGTRVVSRTVAASRIAGWTRMEAVMNVRELIGACVFLLMISAPAL